LNLICLSDINFLSAWFLFSGDWICRVTRRVPLVEEELFTIPVHLNAPPVLLGLCCAIFILLCSDKQNKGQMKKNKQYKGQIKKNKQYKGQMKKNKQHKGQMKKNKKDK
jgi:hypothetical protein